MIFNFAWNLKRPQTGEAALQKKSKVGSFTSLDFQLCHKTVVMKTVRSWHDNGHTDREHRADLPEMNPQLCRRLILDKAGKNIQWGKKSTNGVGKTG